MKPVYIILVSCLMFAVCAEGTASPTAGAANVMPDTPSIGAAAFYAKRPVMFEANRGQSDARVKFLARGPGYTLFLAQQEAVLEFERSSTTSAATASSVLRLKFIGANPDAELQGRDELRGKTNYLLGNDPKQWRRDVPNFAVAAYQGLYPGVDAIFHGIPVSDGRQRLEFDFEVAAGADARRVALEVDGAHRLRLSRNGDVLVDLGDRQEVVVGKPHVYQDIAGRRREVSGEFRLHGAKRLGIALGPYDRSHALIIDPTLAYSTYVLGGQVNGIAVNASAVDAGGSTYTYIVGTTGVGALAVYPNPGVFQTTCPACAFIGSAFVAKYDTTQSGAASLIYSTYLGPAGPAGSNIMPDELGSATGMAIAIDSDGDAYVTGAVQGFQGTNYFPTTNTTACTASNALCGTMQGQRAAFVSVLDPTGGRLLASTFVGGGNSGGSTSGGGADQGTAIAVDGARNVYITGLTNSPGLFTPGAPQQTLQNAFLTGTPFVAKLNSALNQLAYYTYLGGSTNISGISDSAKAIAVDAAGEAYVGGGTYVDACNYVSCAGASGPAFPVPTSAGFQSSPGGRNESGFLAKLNAAGTQLLYFTYVGGGADVNGLDNGTQVNALTLDAGGNAYVTGVSGQIRLPTTDSAAGPVVGGSGACQTTANGPTCPGAFVAEISPGAGGAKSLVFLSYLGGVSADAASSTVTTGIALDSAGDIYIAGSTSTSDMPLPGVASLFPNGVQPSASLPCLALLPECVSPFLVELEPEATSVLFSGYLAGTGGGQYEQDAVAGMALDAHGNVYLAGFEATNDFPVTASAHDSTPPTSSGNSYLAVIGSLPSSAGVTSVANYTLNGVGPALGLLGSQFSVTAPATTGVAVPIVLTNAGGAAFTISGVSLIGTAAPPWSFTSLTCNGSPISQPIATPVSVGPGQSCTILLQFAPTLVQAGQTEGLEILDNASSSNASGSSSEQIMYLNGTGTAAPAASFASYSINGQPIAQANALVPAVTLVADANGTTTGQLVLTNTGGEPFAISGAFVPASVPPSPWSVTSVACPSSVTGPPTATAPVSLAPGQTCVIGLRFAPTALGTFDAALTVADTASGSNLSGPSNGGQQFLVQGTGGQPIADYVVSSGSVSATNTQVTFGNIAQNTPATQSVTVTNNGNGPLSITSTGIAVSLRALTTESYWSLTKDCNTQSGGALFPVTVAPGASCVFTFQFDPAALGNFVALVSFFDNAAQSNLTSTLNGSYIQQVKLYGVGVLPLSGQVSSMTFTPEYLSFTNTSGTQTQTVMVTNTGTQPLKISEVESFLQQGSAFALLQQGCTSTSGTPPLFLPFPVTLASGTSCTFAFQYNAATEESITGGEVPLAVYAGFVDNAYVTNIGSSFGNSGALQGFALLAPGATVFPSCAIATGVGASAGASEGSGGAWVGSVTLTAPSGKGLTGYLLVVLEGLNTTFNEVAGTTPTDAQSVYSCANDLPGSPTVVINANGVTGYGAGVPVPSVSETLHYADGIQPIIQYLTVRPE